MLGLRGVRAYALSSLTKQLTTNLLFFYVGVDDVDGLQTHGPTRA